MGQKNPCHAGFVIHRIYIMRVTLGHGHLKMLPFLTNYCKKDTLFADLCRSAPDSEKHTLFCVFVYKHVNIYDLCDPPRAPPPPNTHMTWLILLPQQ